MTAKPKCKTFIALHNGNFGQPTSLARYRVGARNNVEAEDFLRGIVGKHAKVNAYYEEKDASKALAHGEVVKEAPRFN